MVNRHQELTGSQTTINSSALHLTSTHLVVVANRTCKVRLLIYDAYINQKSASLDSFVLNVLLLLWWTLLLRCASREKPPNVHTHLVYIT